MPRILVLGGAGFIGRHVARALLARGHDVIIGSRRPKRCAAALPPAVQGCERREVHLERLGTASDWYPLLHGVDTVVNAVGILRERGRETYERVHHLAPAALASSCAIHSVRLIHISALGLHPDARSHFIRSKLRGEAAIRACGDRSATIVRPSLLDGEGGFGARWLRALASFPLHFVPAGATGRIAALAVQDLGDAVAIVCELPVSDTLRTIELGGSAQRTLGEHLAALRGARTGRPAVKIDVPNWVARVASHLCDLVHFSPFSFGHLELLRRDNVPGENLLPYLLGRPPKPVGANPRIHPGSRPGFREAAGPAS